MEDINKKVIVNSKKSVIKMYGKTVSYKLICVAIGFINSILINRCLGVALRGEYTTITNWASLLQLFLNLGIGTTYPAFKRKYPKDSKIIFTTLGFLMSGIYLIILIIAFFFIDIQYKYIGLIAYLTTMENFLIFIAIVEDVSKRNIINIVTSFCHTCVLGVIFIFARHNLDAVLISIILNHVILCIAFLLFYKVKKVNFKIINITLIKEVFIIAIPAMFMNMLMYLNYHADVLFLSQMTKDSVQVGLYGTAVTLGNMLWIIPDAFKDIIYNRVAKKDNPGEVVVAILCNIVICSIFLIGFVICGKWFLKTMYGIEYISAYPLVLMLFFGTFPMVLYKLIHPIYIANGKTKIVVGLLTIAVITNIVGNIIFIPRYKGMGAAIASVISYMICGIAFLLKFIKDYNISLFLIIRKVSNIIYEKISS